MDLITRSRLLQISALFCGLLFLVLGKEVPKPIAITEDNWTDVLEGEWLLKFYAPWCPACKGLATVWEKVAGWAEDLEINVAQIDVTENPGLSGRFMVMALPTIMHVKNGEFRTYRNSRDENAIIAYVDDKEWMNIDPLPWWKAPTSIHMGALGLFFKLSMSIRSLHASITEEYGVPVWGSYVLFALATIMLGLLLGLLIVFLCDAIFPPQPLPPVHDPRYYSSIKPDHKLDNDKDSDIIEDDQDENSDQDGEKENLRKRKPQKT